MRAAAAIISVVLGLLRAPPGARADPPLFRAPTLAGSGEEDGPKDWDCRQWQKIHEAKKPDQDNGPMPPCDKGSRLCDLPEWHCDVRDRDNPVVEDRCGASPGNRQRSKASCGNNGGRCRDVDGCMCDGSSGTCVATTCAALQREECPNSLLNGACPLGGKCRMRGFACDLSKSGGPGRKFNCTAAGDGRKQKDMRNADTHPMDDESPGHAVGTTLSFASAVMAAALIASAMNRMW